ncbi:MAG: adenylate/guanylate cyclase domain-containing protein, partial [Planctomycetes bacterium]|nr:adenylate/guanylate cyclase domain-containing protein [Planctomycetota bacterium]
MPRRRKKKAIPSVAPKTRQIDKNVRKTVILFADIMGASEVSNHKTTREYFEFVRAFQKIFLEICREHLEAFQDPDENYYLYDARGDEGLLMIFPPTEESVFDFGRDVDTAITIAFGLKRRWLLSDENTNRIKDSGLLPIDIGIGIHVGHTWIDQSQASKNRSEQNPPDPQNPTGAKPEGYAVNLAKRVESHSRNGRYTNVFLSEAAHGAWQNSPDERTIIFDEQQVIEPKGISRKIAVFEVKHHFLPTDWAELQDVSMRGKSLLNPQAANPELLCVAHKMNPTNFWLTEEYLRQIILKKYDEIPEKERETKKARETAFATALDSVEYLANSDLRDSGILLIQGFIEGECYHFENERAIYKVAMELSPRLAEPYWYTALSYSYQIDASLNSDTSKKKQDLNDEQKKWLEGAFKNFEEAKARSVNSAWILFDYGCETVRWAENNAELSEGIEMVELAANRLPD